MQSPQEVVAQVGGGGGVPGTGEGVTGAAVAALDYSSIRGKAVLVSPTEKQFELLRRRLQERIDDSRGETIFDIGIGEGEIDLLFDLRSFLFNIRLRRWW